MDYVVSITGDREIDKALQDLDKKVRRKIIKGGMTQGIKVMREGAKANAPIGETGSLKESIVSKSQKRSRKGFGINVMSSKKTQDGDLPFHTAAVEFGAKSRGIEAKNTFRDTFEDKGQETLDITIKNIRDKILQAAEGK